MTQVAVGFVPHEHLSSSQAKRDSFLSSGRGGSGNVRRLSTATNDKRPPSLPVLPPRERRSTSTAVRQQFTYSGRGGSGNVQPSTSDLVAHPLTASILNQHSAVQAQYEARVRKVHAESNVVRSSGRGGSGNIYDARRRSRSQEPRRMPKTRFFTTKGRERATIRCDGVTKAHDRQDGNDTDKRTSHATCSSGSSSARQWYARNSVESRFSHAVTSGSDMTADSLPSSEDTITNYSSKRPRFLARWSKPPPPMSPVSPPRSPGSPTLTVPESTYSSGSSLGAHSSTSVDLEEVGEYVSFLEM